jgi:hypothetical protein
MDDARFDAVIRKLAAASSRRGIVRALTISAVGLLSRWPGFDNAEAGNQRRKRRRRKRRKENRCPAARRCGKRCCQKGDRCADPATKTCVTGRGTCAADADSCAVGGGGIQCNPGSPIACTCNRTMEGDTACVNHFQDTSCSNCTTDEECHLPDKPSGMRCIEMTFGCVCGGGSFTSKCAPPCPRSA